MIKLFPVIAVFLVLSAAIIAGIYYMGDPETENDKKKNSDDGINLEKWKEYSKTVDSPEIIKTDPGIAMATPGGELEKIARLEGLNNFTDGSHGSSGDNQSGAPREEAGYSEDDVALPDSDSKMADENEGEVRKVEEADLVKVIDDTLFVLNSYRGLLAIDISDPANAYIAGQCSVIGYPVEMYVVDFLAVITVRTDYNFWYRYWGQEGASGEDSGNIGTMIYIVNVGDPTQPAILKIVELEGFPVESRRVGHVIYQATNNYGWQWNYNEGKDETIVTSIDFGDPDTLGMKDQARFEGSSNQVHASPTAFYIAEPEWIYEQEEREDQWEEPFEKLNDSGEMDENEKIRKRNDNSLWDYPFDDHYRYYTDISYLDIVDPNGDIVVRDSFRVPGQLSDKYQMDEYDDTFRMVTHFWKGIGESRLYIVNISNPNNIKALGTLLVDDEGSLMATRFAGERAYTIHLPRSIDPLDVLDLSDPTNPKLCDVFEMPGWVTHMEVRGMKIIALGVDDSDGQRNIAVSLFDVSDPFNVVMEERVRLGGDYAYSAANWEPKALTIDDTHDIVIVPYTSWSKNYRNPNSGVQIVGFDLDEGDLWLGGNISGPYSIERTRVVGDWILATSFKSLQVMDIGDLKSPSMVKMVELCINVKDLIPAGDFIIQMVQDWYEGNVVIRSVRDANDIGAMDILTLESNWARLFSMDDTLILAANVLEDDKLVGKLFQVSVNAGGDITSTALQGLPDGFTFGDSSNYYPWYGYYEDDIMIDRSRYSSRSVYYPDSSGDRFVIIGNSLIYYHIGEHPYSKYEYNEKYDQYMPTPEEKGSDELFVFNLSDLSNVPAPASIKLESYSFMGMSVWDQTVYIQHRMSGVNIQNRSQYNNWNNEWYDYYYYEWYYKNHVTGINCDDTASFSLIGEYNVPGRMIGTGKDVIYTVSEWSDDRNNMTLNTLTLYDDAAEITSAVNLGNGWVEVVMHGETAYVVDRPYNYYYYGYRDSGDQGINTSFRIIDFTLPNDPVLQASASLEGTLNIELVDDGHIVFHDSSLSSMVVYNTEIFPDMEFESMLLLQGYASSLRISNDVLYVPQGYYGALSVEL
ncbi:MAG: beta-propeller domain-containing protein [Candidatus Thermoplasmatota archaeon]|nr:beta-propeller domain-containing protein [Candidatus Thermoplasmatota archaeon]